MLMATLYREDIVLQFLNTHVLQLELLWVCLFSHPTVLDPDSW